MSRLEELLAEYKRLCMQDPLPVEELAELSRKIDKLERIVKGCRAHDC